MSFQIWDTRTGEIAFEVYEQQEGTISQMAVHSSMHYLLSTSTNGTLGVYDLRKGNNAKDKLYALSDQMEEEYLCLSLVKDEQKVAVGTSSGAIGIFNWDWFGDVKDRVIGHPEGVECMVKYNENVLLTGGEDGWVRVVGLFPSAVNLFQKHEEDSDEPASISGIDMSHDSRILGTISHDCSINFYDLTEISDQLDELDLGQKVELADKAELKIIHKDLNQKGITPKNKEKIEKKVMDKQKKIQFFKDL